MEAKDGSFGFDLEEIYDEIKNNEWIKYHLSDNRTVEVLFEKKNNSTLITQTFEAETENNLEFHRFGWQAILENFKNYTENN